MFNEQKKMQINSVLRICAWVLDYWVLEYGKLWKGFLQVFDRLKGFCDS